MNLSTVVKRDETSSPILFPPFLAPPFCSSVDRPCKLKLKHHCVLSSASSVQQHSKPKRSNRTFGCGRLGTMSFPHQHTPPPISGQRRHPNDRGRVVPDGPFAVPPELARRLMQLSEMVALGQIHRLEYWSEAESAIQGWLASPPATPQTMTCRFTHLGSLQLVPPEVMISLGRSIGHIIDYPFPSFPLHPDPYPSVQHTRTIRLRVLPISSCSSRSYHLYCIHLAHIRISSLSILQLCTGTSSSNGGRPFLRSIR